MEGSLLVDSAAANLGAATAARRRRARFLSCPCSASSGMNDIALPSSARSTRHPGSHLLLVTRATVESRCTGDEGLGVLLLRLQDAEDGEAGVARERVVERRQWPRPTGGRRRGRRAPSWRPWRTSTAEWSSTLTTCRPARASSRGPWRRRSPTGSRRCVTTGRTSSSFLECQIATQNFIRVAVPGAYGSNFLFQGKKGVWLKLPLDRSEFIPLALKVR